MADNILGRNKVFPIYNEDGTVFHNLVLRKSTVDSVVMSLGDKITGDVYYKDTTLAVTMGEYIVYNDVKYTLVNPPTVVKEGMVSDNGDLNGMTKYSFVFYHPMYHLLNFPFTDVAVQTGQEKYLSQNKSFSWIGTLVDYVAKINKNLQGTQWICAISSNVPQEERTALSEVMAFENATIADALKRGYETWEVPYIIDQIKEGETYYSQGKRFLIQFGLPSQEIIGSNNQPFVFKYGQGVGLKNHSRNPRNNKIITRIAGYGSEDNIPWGYPQIVWTGNQGWKYTVNNDPTAANSYPIYDGVVGGAKVKLIKHPFTRTHLMPSIYRDTVNKKVNPNASGYNPSIEIKDYYDADSTYANPMVQDSPSYEIHEFEKIKPELGVSQIEGAVPYSGTVASDGEILLSDFKLKVMERASSTSIDMERTALLGLYDNITLPSSYVDSGSQEAYSYQSSIGASTDNKRKVEFKSSNVNFSEVVVVPNETPSSSTEWIDDIDENGNYIQGYFEITLPILSFDLYASAALTQEMQINMRSGACIGCTFQVQVDWEDYRKNFYDAEGNFAPNGAQRNLTKYPKSDEQQITVIVQKDTNTFGTLMPNIYQQPAAGDEYVILGISLPLSYISDAEERLDADMKQYMRDNNVYYFDYPLKFDEYFLAKNINILSQLRTNTIVRFQYNSEQLALYVKQLTIKYDNTPLPQYDITLTDDVEIVLNPVGQVSDDVSKLRMLIGQGGVGSGSTTFDSNAPFVRKDIDDTTNNIIRILNGLQLGENFSTGLLGEGGIIRVDADGKTYVEADKLYVRMKFYADTVEVRRFLHTGGNSIKSVAGINCTRVEYIDSNGNVTSDPEEAARYRCYFKATDNDRKITNDFVVGDLAFCGETNVDNGSLSRHRYWRAVVGRNAEGVTNENNEMWIDLSANDCEAGSSIPLAQDDIIQLGNKTDTTRQGAIIEYVSGEDAPSYMIYQGINNYSLNGRNKLALGYNSSTGRAYLNVYGDFFFGNNAQSGGQYTGSYIKYNAQTGALDIKGSISATSTIGGDDFDTYVKAHQNNYNDTDVYNYINEVKSDLQEQIDGAIETISDHGEPTGNNDPYASLTPEQKERHIGDMYYDIDTGYGYRYVKDGNTFYWLLIEDSDVQKALADAANALLVAGGKGKIFTTSVGTLPTPPYNVNDVWVNATYPSNATSTDAANHRFYNDILKCVTARAGGGTPSINDWVTASKYTDDSNLNAFITQILNGTGASGNAATVGSALYAIKHALTEGETLTNGGLVLSNMLNLGTGSVSQGTFTTYAGMNGVYDANKTTGGIAAWYGGAMLDKEDGATTGYAKSLFRFDGSGYLAGGNITWDKNGIITIANVYSNVDGAQVAWSGQSLQYITNLATLLPTKLQSGVTYLDPKVSFWSLSIQGKAVATQEWVSQNYISVAYFNRLFQAYKSETISDANKIAANDVTTTISNLKLMVGTWTEQYITALGINPSGGGGSSTTLAGLTDVNVDSATNGQVLTYQNGYWVNGAASGGSSAWADITGKPSTIAGYGIIDAKIVDGVITLGANSITPLTSQSLTNYVTYTAMENTLAGYLPLSGGTMTGGLTAMAITPSANNAYDLGTNGSRWKAIYTGDIYSTYFSFHSGGYLQEESSKLMWHKDNGSYTVIHSGNIDDYATNISLSTTGSGNAFTSATFSNGTLTLTKGSMFATQSWVNTQLGSYLPLSGGTMTGKLKWNNSSAIYGVTSTGFILCMDAFADGGETHYITPANLSVGSATKATQDGAGNVITSKYVTLDTAQTINGAKTFSTTVRLNGYGIEDVSGAGLLIYHPTGSWSGISSSQWGVGSIDSQGVIRSNASNLVHYRGGTNYNILDTYCGPMYSAFIYPYVGYAIASGDDLNERLDAGTYYCQNSSIAGSLSHTPYTSGNFRMWNVYNTGTSGSASSSYFAQIILAPNEGNMWIRSHGGSSFGDWHRFIKDNGGTMTGSLTFNANSLGIACTNGTYRMTFMIGSGGSNRGIWDDNANEWTIYKNANNYTVLGKSYNVGIGTDSPSYKLHVVGIIYATGGVTALSDMRMKNMMADLNTPIEKIANLPLFYFKYKQGDDDYLHIGTSAQAVNEILPELVTKKDTWGLDYSVLGTAIGILNSRKLVSHDEEIKALKNEILLLKQRIKTLEAA